MKLKEIGPDKKHVFIEAPCRENINSIDQLILRAKEYSCS